MAGLYKQAMLAYSLHNGSFSQSCGNPMACKSTLGYSANNLNRELFKSMQGVIVCSKYNKVHSWWYNLIGFWLGVIQWRGRRFGNCSSIFIGCLSPSSSLPWLVFRWYSATVSPMVSASEFWVMYWSRWWWVSSRIWILRSIFWASSCSSIMFSVKWSDR